MKTHFHLTSVIFHIINTFPLPLLDYSIYMLLPEEISDFVYFQPKNEVKCFMPAAGGRVLNSIHFWFDPSVAVHAF